MSYTLEHESGFFKINKRYYPTGSKDVVLDDDQETLTVISTGADSNIISLTKYDQLINGDTGVAFASYSELVDFVESYFFTKPGTGGGGDGGGGTADFTETNNRLGAKTEQPATNTTGTWSINSILRLIAGRLSWGAKTSENSLSVTPATDSGFATSENQEELLSKLPASLNADGGLAVHLLNSILSDDLGLKSDVPATTANYTGSRTLISLNKFLVSLLLKGQAAKAGSLSVVPASDTYGQGTMATSQPVTLASDQPPIPTTPRANNTGSNGSTPFRIIAAATNNAQVVKATPGNLYSIVAIGLTSTVRYLKFYNKATAPNAAADTPVMTIPIPTNTQGAGVALPFSMGVNFPLGIAVLIVAGIADTDNTPIAANDVIVNLTYA
jgi:hypothetical protein